MNHGWTHANGIDPIPGLSSSGGSFPFMLPWLRRNAWSLSLSVPTGAANEVLVTGYGSSEGSTTPAWADYFAATTNGFQTIVHGVFTVTVQATFESSFAGRCWFSLSDEIGSGTVIGDVLANADGWVAASWPCQRWAAGTDVLIEVGQDSGSARDLDSIYLEVMMIGDYDGTERIGSDLEQ